MALYGSVVALQLTCVVAFIQLHTVIIGIAACTLVNVYTVHLCNFVG